MDKTEINLLITNLCHVLKKLIKTNYEVWQSGPCTEKGIADALQTTFCENEMKRILLMKRIIYLKIINYFPKVSNLYNFNFTTKLIKICSLAQ